LLDLEIAQALRRYARTGQIPTERCRAALEDLCELPLIRHPHDILLPRIWELRNNLSAYDAAYVALAEALDAPLLTRDERLASA
jgi:predicted nucleic acid-binding protein